jgi:hypothetical protein
VRQLFSEGQDEGFVYAEFAQPLHALFHCRQQEWGRRVQDFLRVIGEGEHQRPPTVPMAFGEQLAEQGLMPPMDAVKDADADAPFRFRDGCDVGVNLHPSSPSSLSLPTTKNLPLSPASCHRLIGHDSIQTA